MGYCEIKLEKERRLRRQRDYLQADIEVLSRFLGRRESSEIGLRSLPYAKVAQQLAIERARSDEPGPFFHRSKENFITAGLLEMVRQDSEVLEREKADIDARLESFSGFMKKRTVLEEERKVALSSLAPTHSSKIRKVNESFQRIEARWNSLTEDSLNLDEGVFYLSRNSDYIKSSRGFLIAAKGNFDIETWIDGGCADDLFRHSNIGRAKEMIDGANRNLKLARMELCCTEHVRVQIDAFEPVLVEFLGSLFDDIFLDGRLTRSITVVEKALRDSGKLVQKTRQKRESLHSKLERVERDRDSIFQRLDGDKRGRLAAR
jgi:hypothetical protein